MRVATILLLGYLLSCGDGGSEEVSDHVSSRSFKGHEEDADHNAGAMVRGVIAVRIDPTPAGVEEFEHMNGGWAYLDAGQLIIYGRGVH